MNKPTETPKVSIIIPTFNRKKYLERALKSVYKQSFKDYEVIVIDDGSTDGTSDWIKKNYSNVSLITINKNRGASFARNQGIVAAKGKYVAFLDSDDCWKENYLLRQVAQLEVDSKRVLSWCDCLAMLNDKMKAMELLPLFKEDLIACLLVAPFIETMSCVLVRRDTLLKTTLLSEEITVSHDNDLYLQLCRFGEFVHLKDFLVIRDKYSTGNLTQNALRWRDDDYKVLDRFFGNETNQDYKYLEKDIRHAMVIRDRLRTETNAQVLDIWSRRLLFKFEMKHFKNMNFFKKFLSDVIMILAFIKQQFLGIKRWDTKRFPNFQEKIKYFFYLFKRLFDPFIWTLFNYHK